MVDTGMLQMVLDKISLVDKKVTSLERKTEEGFKEVNKRLDTIGSGVAHLEDDTPTVGEQEDLEKRVGKLEKQTASV